MILPSGPFRHVQPAALCFQLLIERLLQDEAVNKVTANIEVVVLPCYLHGEVLPLWVSQVHIFQGNHVLEAIHPIDEVQGVGPTIGNDLKLPLTDARTL